MITTYLRSSSYNDWDFCQMKYYLRYVLGLPDESNKAADKGNIVHKAMELLGKRRVSELNSIATVSDEALGDSPVDCKALDPEHAISAAWMHCTSQFTHHEWVDKDFKECKKWMYDALEYRDGMFNPLKLDIIAVEQKFDIEIIKPWSKYSFNTPHGMIEGWLALKGTVDVVASHDKRIIEVIDWKTGARKNWNTGQEKTLTCLEKDPQLRLYHYAISKLYPDADGVFITIFFIKDGGPYSVFFDKSDLPKTEEMLQERFQNIKDSIRPKRIYPDWKCSKLCYYGKTLQEGTSNVICSHFNNEIIKVGLEKVTNKNANFKALTEYGAGGGVYKK